MLFIITLDQNKKTDIHSFLISARKSAPPLDVSGLPGYDKISDREREVRQFFSS